MQLAVSIHKLRVQAEGLNHTSPFGSKHSLCTPVACWLAAQTHPCTEELAESADAAGEQGAVGVQVDGQGYCLKQDAVQGVGLIGIGGAQRVAAANCRGKSKEFHTVL